MNGFADREPVLPPMYLADCMAALNGYGAVMVALGSGWQPARRGVLRLLPAGLRARLPPVHPA